MSSAATRVCLQVKLVLQRNRYFVEASDAGVLNTLLRDDVISRARIASQVGGGTGGMRVGGWGRGGGRGHMALQCRRGRR